MPLPERFLILAKFQGPRLPTASSTTMTTTTADLGAKFVGQISIRIRMPQPAWKYPLGQELPTASITSWKMRPTLDAVFVIAVSEQTTSEQYANLLPCIVDVRALFLENV